jgi:uncharacterized protein YkwD
MRRHLLIAALVAATLGCTSAPAYAKPADRAAALAAFRAEQADETVPAGWTGSVDGCVVGTESAESLDATLRAVNRLRDFAGLSPVTFEAQYNHNALAAALMMLAKGELSHNPDPGWPCYSDEGYDGASHSNLFYGVSGAAAMVGYVDDEGIDSLGHRRWVLDARSTVFGSGSTGQTNALYVITNAPRATVPAVLDVAWPPAGWVPWQWIFKDWSIEASGSGPTIDFSNAQVSVTVDGHPATVSNRDQFGSVLKWQVDLAPTLTSGDHVLHVSVSGATADGQPHPIEYDVNAFAPDAVLLAWVHKPSIARADGRKRAVRPGVRLEATASVAGGRISGYRWLRGGKLIAGASKRTYKVRKADRRKKVACRVTAIATDGSKTLVRTSRAVRVK